MANPKDITRLQQCITNSLDPGLLEKKKLAGVIGDSPSRYSKSPALWNAAFRWLGLDAVYVALDVEKTRLKDLFAGIRACEAFMGVNVTVPYKLAVMEYLDELDPPAARIQAVNTIVRTAAGRLIGYNTDGLGFIESILRPQPNQDKSFVESLAGLDVLLLGAGGSARALSFHLSQLQQGGCLLISNRTTRQARALAAEIGKQGGNAKAIAEAEVAQWAPRAGLIINCTTKGQGGLRRLADGKFTDLEPYSALAAADPPAAEAREFSDNNLRQGWMKWARPDIDANNRASLALMRSIPPHVGFYDLIYHPEETVFLRHARETGHRTMNGKGMIICQAAIALRDHICRRELATLAKDDSESYRELLQVMYSSW